MHPKRPDGSPDAEFYDDAGLYKAWLRDYASRGGSRKGGSAVPLQRPRRRRVSRSKAAACARGPRQLKNFMFPVPRAPPPVDVGALVASLFK